MGCGPCSLHHSLSSRTSTQDRHRSNGNWARAKAHRRRWSASAQENCCRHGRCMCAVQVRSSSELTITVAGLAQQLASRIASSSCYSWAILPFFVQWATPAVPPVAPQRFPRSCRKSKIFFYKLYFHLFIVRTLWIHLFCGDIWIDQSLKHYPHRRLPRIICRRHVKERNRVVYEQLTYIIVFHTNIFVTFVW